MAFLLLNVCMWRGNVYSFLYLKLHIRLWDACEGVCSPNPRWMPPLRGRTFMTGRSLLNGTTFFPKVLLNPPSPCIATGRTSSAWPHTWPQVGGMKRRRVSISEGLVKSGALYLGFMGFHSKFSSSLSPEWKNNLVQVVEIVIKALQVNLLWKMALHKDECP